MFERRLIVFNDQIYQNKFDVIADLAKIVTDKVTSTDAYFSSVKEREETIPTYIEYGVALPHAKTDAVKKPFVVYEKLAHGVQWGSGHEIANHVFMIGVPEKYAGNLHLKIISELSKNLMREAFRNRLLNAESTEEVYQVLMIVEEDILT